MVLSQEEIQCGIKSIVDDLAGLQATIECDDDSFESLAQIRKELIQLWVNTNRAK